MTTSLLRPNAAGTQGSSGVSLTGASIHAAWSDNSDSTFVAYTATAGYATAEVGTVTLPAGAMTKALYPYVRTQLSATGSASLAFEVYCDRGGANPALLSVNAGVSNAFSSPYTVTFGAVPVHSMTQAEVDSLRVRVYGGWSGITVTSFAVYEVYLELVYATQPVVDVTLPTGAQATSQPTVAWTYTAGADGGPQAFTEVAVFSAAQYGIGGFDPATSPATYRAGPFVGTATAIGAGPLENSTTYRAYVRSAQLINGAQHWSAWDYSGFTTSFTTANVLSVTPTASNADGYISVSVARSTAGANTAWQAVEVQRSTDGGTTWETLRGGDQFSATNAFVTAWGANTAVIRDYETGNGESVTYRARAFTAASGADVWGAYVSSSSTSWSSTAQWLKNPFDPTDNVSSASAKVRSIFNVRRERERVEHWIPGRRTPVVVSSPTLHSPAGVIELVTGTDAAALAVLNLFESVGTVLIQLPATDQWGSKYVSVGPLTETRVIDHKYDGWRFWEVEFVEVDAPTDEIET